MSDQSENLIEIRDLKYSRGPRAIFDGLNLSIKRGEITAIMENEETVLGPGDVLIQRGTNHAWTNRSGKPARVAFVLIGGRWE